MEASVTKIPRITSTEQNITVSWYDSWEELEWAKQDSTKAKEVKRMEVDVTRKINEIQEEIEKGAKGLTLRALLEKLYNDGVLEGTTRTKLASLPTIVPRFVEKQPVNPYTSPTTVPFNTPWMGGSGDVTSTGQNYTVSWYNGSGGVSAVGNGGSGDYTRATLDSSNQNEADDKAGS
jgi:hypothetical protein